MVSSRDKTQVKQISHNSCEKYSTPASTVTVRGGRSAAASRAECEMAPAHEVRRGHSRSSDSGYIRRAIRSNRHRLLYLTNPGCSNRAMEVITFRAKPARLQLALAPVGPALLLYRLHLTRVHVQNDLIDLASIERPLDAQYRGQNDHDIAIGPLQKRRFCGLIRSTLLAWAAECSLDGENSWRAAQRDNLVTKHQP